MTARSAALVEGPSFEELLLPLLESAYSTAARFTRNPADAEDLVHEAVMLACRGFGSFRGGTNFKAWFFRILTNCYLSKFRRERRRGTAVELEDTPELYLYLKTAGAGLHRKTEDPAGLLLDRLDAEAVADAVGRLPDDYRVVATLHFIDDMAYQDIATTLEIPIGTVRSRLHRGRRMLQRELWRIAQDRGIVAELVGEARP